MCSDPGAEPPPAPAPVIAAYGEAVEKITAADRAEYEDALMLAGLPHDSVAYVGALCLELFSPSSRRPPSD